MAGATVLQADEALQQLRTLEAKNRFILNVMEQVLSFGDFQKEVDRSLEPNDFIQLAVERINEIIKFDVSAMYFVDQQSAALERVCCFPGELQDALEAQFEAMIRDGYVAWALREKRGIMVYSADKRNCVLLHVMATYARIRGLFIGLFPVHSNRLPDGSLQALSLVLRNAANALESIEYLGMFQRQNADLQIKVDQKVEELRQRDQELLNARKMDAIVTLSGGVAHQYNNALAVLVGNLDLMRFEIAQGKDLNKSFERIEAVSQKMHDLTYKLLAYARGGKYKPETVLIETIVEKSLIGVGKTVETPFELEMALPTDVYCVQVDMTQMQLALEAIVTNAIEALESGGRIVISAEKVSVYESAPASQMELMPGDYVVLQITDNGKGMDENTRQCIFDPYFTTKFTGRGLSMAATYGIIKNHRGEIAVESKLGQGTTVKVYLPLANELSQLNN
jgi:signal transduction histidine kinase